MSQDTPVVASLDWLDDHLDDPTVRVVDVRDAWEYDSIGHVPGAVSIPFDAFRRGGDGTDAAGGGEETATDEGMLPGVERFGALLGEAGISREDTLVAYDDEHGVFAARFVVTALMYGHEDVHLLGGDYSAWSRDHAVTTEAPGFERVDYAALVPDDRPLVDASAVEAAVDDPHAVVVDTRTRAEYDEGHIAGAVQLDWRALVDPESRGLLPREELLNVLADHGIVPENRVVLYCNTARRISHTYVALRWVGFPEVDFYEGSLTDWTERGRELVPGE